MGGPGFHLPGYKARPPPGGSRLKIPGTGIPYTFAHRGTFFGRFVRTQPGIRVFYIRKFSANLSEGGIEPVTSVLRTGSSSAESV